MKSMIAPQVAAGVVIASVEPAEKIVFLGMTTSQLISVGAGVVVGGALCYAGYKYYRKRSNEEINIFKEKGNLKSIKELMARQEHIATLDSANLQNWFHINHVEIEEAKLMIAIPNDKVLNAVGYKLDDADSKLDKCIIQSIYNSKNGKVYKLRFLAYDSIESNLQAKLLENNGLVILDD